jgi:enoyl-CoA hydratase/carnithine racemase
LNFFSYIHGDDHLFKVTRLRSRKYKAFHPHQIYIPLQVSQTEDDRNERKRAMIEAEIRNRIKLMKMSYQKANAMDAPFLQEIADEFEENAQFDGAVLTGHGRFFSAGLNLVSLSHGTTDDVKTVFTALANVLKNVMTFPGPVIAVVNGHAVAGGCLLALCCDYRIGVAGDYKMGINEMAIGLDLPPLGLAVVRRSVATNHLFDIASLGKFYTPDDAVSVGLLNELADADSAVELALEKAERMAATLAPFQRLKERMLQPETELLTKESGSVDEFVDQWFAPETQAKIKEAVARLKGS